MKVPDSMHPDCRVFCGLMLASALGAVRHACRACFMVLRTQIQKRGRLSKSFLDCFEGMPTGKAAAAPFTARNWSQLSEGAPPPATKCPGPCPQTRRRNQDQRQVVFSRLLAKNGTKPLPASFFLPICFPLGELRSLHSGFPNCLLFSFFWMELRSLYGFVSRMAGGTKKKGSFPFPVSLFRSGFNITFWAQMHGKFIGAALVDPPLQDIKSTLKEYLNSSTDTGQGCKDKFL